MLIVCSLESSIDLDVRDIKTEMVEVTVTGYAEALKILKAGKNSKKSDTEIRSLEGMRLNNRDMRRHGTPFGKLMPIATQLFRTLHMIQRWRH